MQSIGVFHVYYNFYRFLCIIFNYKYTCVSVCGYAPTEVEGVRPLGLELEAAVKLLMWVPGTESGALEKRYVFLWLSSPQPAALSLFDSFIQQDPKKSRMVV